MQCRTVGFDTDNYVFAYSVGGMLRLLRWISLECRQEISWVIMILKFWTMIFYSQLPPFYTSICMYKRALSEVYTDTSSFKCLTTKLWNYFPVIITIESNNIDD